MNFRAVVFSTAAIAVFGGSAVTAQGRPGTNVDVDVLVVNAKPVIAGVQISYVLRNRATSTERLFEFTISVPQGVANVAVDASTDRWLAMTRYRGQSVAQWGALGDEMQPGDSSPVLSYSAPGMIGVVTGRIRGYVPSPTALTEDTTNRIFHPEPDPLLDQSKTVQILGIIPAPAGGVTEAIAAIGDDFDLACGPAGWISPSGICNSLRQKLNVASASLARGDAESARNQLNALLHELDAQRGKHVSDNAYWLLTANVTYVLGKM